MEQEPNNVEMLPAEILATVGHEFRGPLTTIQGYATTLLRHEQQLTLDERRDFLRAISEAGAHLGKLVDRFLELAQLESKAHAFAPERVNLLALAQETIVAAQKSHSHLLLQAPERSTQLSFIPNGEPEEEGSNLIIAGDRRLLRTMLDLLLENAMAYSAPESLIEVTLESTSAASALGVLQSPALTEKHRALIVPATFHEQEPLLAIHVQDRGIGISPEHLRLIFSRFYRVDTSLTREVNGLGLGLALCKAIVELHRGMLWVESEVGVGSTFSLVLPCGMAAAIDENVQV